MSKRRRELERKVDVLKNRSISVQRGQGNCVECKVQVVIDDLLIKEEQISDQITQVAEANCALKDEFEVKMVEVK